jgi:chromosome segregation ATPase
MNQPTREEFEELKEEVRRLREQVTEPIKVTVERRELEVERKLDNHAEMLNEISRKQDEQFNHLKEDLASLARRQNEYDKGLILHSRNISTLQDEMKGARADILAIRESQTDFRDKLETVATKDDILRIRESQADQRDRIKELKDTMATKDDISALKSDIRTLKATQERQELLLQEILDRLPPK